MKEPSNTDYFLKIANADRSCVSPPFFVYLFIFFFQKGSLSRVKKPSETPCVPLFHACCSMLPKKKRSLRVQLELNSGS